MPAASDRLRGVSDALLRDLQELVDAEQEKRRIQPDDPRLVELAAEVDAIARRVLDLTKAQHEITEDVHELAAEGGPDAPTESIEETIRPMGVILAEWRAAERDVASAAAGSAEAKAARATSDRLRSEYRRAYEARRS